MELEMKNVSGGWTFKLVNIYLILLEINEIKEFKKLIN